MKSKRRLVIVLTYATAVFLAAKAQSSLQGWTNQIIFGAIYLGPAVILHLLINRFWGEDNSGTSSE
jgi:Mn2+/Fe2+ NRAMP family transporter